MKTNYLILFFSIVFLQAASQSWCAPGAVWHYQVSGSGVDGVLEYRYVSDTVLNNTNCKKISGTFSGTTSAVANTYTLIPNYRNYYTYENNKVVCLYNGSSFDTVANFAASIGDSWLALRSDFYPFACDFRGRLTVTDTGSVFINGHRLKTISTIYTSNIIIGTNTYSVSESNKFIERVQNYKGDWSGNDLFPIYCEHGNTIVEFYNYTFRCYEDGSFPLYNTGKYGCNSLTGLTTRNKETEMIVYPNPAADALYIRAQDTYSGSLNCAIINVLGTTVSSRLIESPDYPVKVDISELSSGIYVLEIVGAEKSRSVSLFSKL